jgi:AraC-like DNA-binding protein
MSSPQIWDRQYPLRAVVHLHESGKAPRPTGYHVAPRRIHRTVLEYVDRGTWLVRHPYGKPLRATAGRFFVVPTDCPHELTQIGPASQSYWWMLSLLDPQGRDLLQPLHSPWLVSAAASRQLRQMLRRLRSAPSPDIAQHLDQQSLDMSVLSLLMRTSPHGLPPRPQTESRIEAVLAHIQQHLAGRLSRSALAEVAGLSPTRFHYVFAEATGVSPTQYVITQRMHRARELLVGTSESVKAIARDCGFADPARFSRFFHKKVGISPLAYRGQFSGHQGGFGVVSPHRA